MEPSSRKKELSFKGRGSALRVAFEGAMVPGIIDVMTELRDAGNLVLSHPLIIDFKALSVSRTWLLAFLRDVVFPMNLSVTLWAATDPGTLDTLASLGFKLDTTPLRSGQTLFHEGDVLMLGPLHSGAEISATGSIIVLGDLEGLVHAGCTGNNNASVVTTGYRTNQMRIGSMISNVMEPGASPWWGRPVRIYVEGGVFVASDIVHSKDR